MTTTAQSQDPSNLAELMARYIGGDEGAFEELYRETAPRIFGQLLRWTDDRALAEDVLQIAFVKVHRARGNYRRGAAVLPWMMVIARNALHDERRGLRHRLEITPGDDALRAYPISSQPVERRSELKNALDHLPTHYRDAIELTKLAGLSSPEAAQLLNTTRAAIKLRVHRGYHLLRQLLTAAPETAEAA